MKVIMYCVLFCLSMSALGQKRVLEQVLEKVKREFKPVVIFDLDDTLFSSSLRSQVIFQEFAASEQAHQKFQQQLSLLKSIKVEGIEYSIKGTLEKHGIFDDEFQTELLDFWKQRFF